MMSGILLVFMLFGSAVLQGLLPPVAWLAGAKAPFLLATAVCGALTRSRGGMLAGAVGAGVFQDALSFVPLGTSAVLYGIAGLLINPIRDVVVHESVIPAAVLGAITACVVTLATWMLLSLGEESPISLSLGNAILKAFGTALLAAVVTPIIFKLAKKLERLVDAGGNEGG
jgi:rod shape-determining protein MreD